MTSGTQPEQPSVNGNRQSAAERMRAYRRRRRRGLRYVRSHARGRRLNALAAKPAREQSPHAVSQLDFFAVVKVEGVATKNSPLGQLPCE
jgi:hypothetical protein